MNTDKATPAPSSLVDLNSIGTTSTLVKGRPKQLNTVVIDGKTYRVSEGFCRIVKLDDEWYDDVPNPERLIAALRRSNAPGDILSFWQRLPDCAPQYPYYHEPDSVAAIPITSYDHWWNKQINSKVRNLVRKSTKTGVVVRETVFDDAFVKGMADIFNETPIRQDRPFWHFGKGVDAIRRDFSNHLFREDIFGAYYNDALIGFVFLAYAGKYAVLGQILSKIEHRDKAPTNALVAKAVEVCAQKGIPYLVYERWTTGSLGHFKQQNAFEEFPLPRYYVPLTLRGRLVLALRLHNGARWLIPDQVKDTLTKWRRRWYARSARPNA